MIMDWARYVRATTWAESVTRQLAVRGICCADFDLERGLTCRGRVPGSGVSRDVLFFIPPFYHPSCGQADVTVNFHGYLLGEDFESAVPGRFGFDRLLASSGRNSILMVPVGEGGNPGPYAFDSEFGGDEGKFPSLMSAAGRLFADTGLSDNRFDPIGRITLTAHSAGGRIVNSVLGQGPVEGAVLGEPGDLAAHYRSKISEVALFDATYAYGEPTQNFARRSPPLRFTSAFQPGGGPDGTEDASRAYWSGLSDSQKTEICRKSLGPSASDVSLARCRADWRGSRINEDPDADRLRDASPAFIRANVQGDNAHFDVFSKYYSTVLRAGTPPEPAACKPQL